MNLPSHNGAHGAPYQSGFTLIELIIVIVLLSILGTMGADFISQAFKGFHATDARQEIYEEGKMALVRMEREIHIAVPNAIEMEPGGEGLRFGMIDEQVMRSILGRYEENDPTGGSTLTDESASPPAGTIISIYNRTWTDFTGAPSVRRLYQVADAGPPFTLSKAIIAGSPYRRFYPVDRAARYFLDGTTLRRAEIAIQDENVDLSAFPAGYPLVRGIKQGTLRFSYAPGTFSRNAVVSVTFTLARDDEEIAFHKEIQVRNVP